MGLEQLSQQGVGVKDGEAPKIAEESRGTDQSWQQHDQRGEQQELEEGQHL